MTEWWNTHKGEPWQSRLPFLYQKYTGHDNNRDWYTFFQKESQLTLDVHNKWHPQVVIDQHQMGSGGARIFVPPFEDPVEPNVDPVLMSWLGSIGPFVGAYFNARNIPGDQENLFEVGELLDILNRAQVEIQISRSRFTADGREYASGSYLIEIAQPYGRFAKAVLERQEYPDLRLYEGGPPDAPYDVTGHTLPLLMGLDAIPVDSWDGGLFTDIRAEPEATTRPQGENARAVISGHADGRMPSEYVGGAGGAGLQAEDGLWFRRNMALLFEDPAVITLARYGSNDLLMSGYALGAEYLHDKVAAGGAVRGEGAVILFGFTPQYRAQSRNTMKMLFNTILGAGNPMGAARLLRDRP